MNIKKFEAYKYRGPELTKVSRKQFIEEFVDLFIDQKICEYEVNGASYYPDNGELLLHCDIKDSNGKYVDFKMIKLDISDMGIEIGMAEWNDDKEEFDDFIPEVNLDTDITKQVREYRQNIKNNINNTIDVKKFEAYRYRGPELTKVTREQFIEEFIDMLIDQKICGYEINGTIYYHNTGELLLICQNQDSKDDKMIKLDLSDMGIEIGMAEWNEDEEDFDDFVTEVNLDTDITKHVKDYKKNIKKYNI